MKISTNFTAEDQSGNRVSVAEAEEVLSSLGVLRADKWVVLRGEVTAWYVATVAALVRAGVPFLPSDNLSQSECRRLIYCAGFRSTAIIFLQCDSKISLQGEEPGNALPDFHGIQCLVTTSGTTGNPKPIVFHSTAIENSIFGLERVTGTEPWSGRVLHANNPMFDGFLEEVILTARSGGTIVIPQIPLRLNPLDIPQIIRHESIDVIDLPTGLFNVFASLGAADIFENSVLIVIGGQQFVQPAVDRFRAIFPKCRIVNTYGPSEATITCCAHELSEVTSNRQLIGKPYFGVDWKIEPADAICSLDEGQLMLSGGQVSLSAKGAQVDGWYPTGDRVRVLTNGGLEYLGRLDSLVKVAGRRIDLVLVTKNLEECLGTRVYIKNEILSTGIDALVVTLYGEVKSSVSDFTQKTRECLQYLDVPIIVKHEPNLNLNKRGKEEFEGR